VAIIVMNLVLPLVLPVVAMLIWGTHFMAPGKSLFINWFGLWLAAQFACSAIWVTVVADVE
jgi:hypothetical protein